MLLRTVACLIAGAALAFSQPLPGIPIADDQMAIERTIESLNDPSQLNDVFARRGDGPARYAELRKSTPARGFRILGPMDETVAPAVIISHEPWGEAQLNLPAPWRADIVFVSARVALAEGACTYEEANGSTQRKRLLFVMRKEYGAWKIASLRVIAP